VSVFGGAGRARWVARAESVCLGSAASGHVAYYYGVCDACRVCMPVASRECAFVNANIVQYNTILMQSKLIQGRLDAPSSRVVRACGRQLTSSARASGIMSSEVGVVGVRVGSAVRSGSASWCAQA
jgi:hypothetical protein